MLFIREKWRKLCELFVDFLMSWVKLLKSIDVAVLLNYWIVFLTNFGLKCRYSLKEALKIALELFLNLLESHQNLKSIQTTSIVIIDPLKWGFDVSDKSQYNFTIKLIDLNF